jgi:molybdopterin-guanine dinucleotide biosynthesis protein A
MTRRSDVTAIVLAGGRSSRFGSDKLAVEIDGISILQRAIHAVGSVANEILVAGAAVPSSGFAGPDDPPIRGIPDDEAFAGPLAALAGALRETTTGLAIVVGGDMPGLVTAVLELMLLRLASDEDVDAVVLEGVGSGAAHRQVLPLALRVPAAAGVAADSIRAGDRSLVRLVGRLRVHVVPAAAWLAVDSAGATLFDVDRRADLRQIQRKFR